MNETLTDETALRMIRKITSISLEGFSDTELAVMSLALLVDTFPCPEHAYYKRAAELNLFDANDTVHSITEQALRLELPRELKRRENAE